MSICKFIKFNANPHPYIPFFVPTALKINLCMLKINFTHDKKNINLRLPEAFRHYFFAGETRLVNLAVESIRTILKINEL